MIFDLNTGAIKTTLTPSDISHLRDMLDRRADTDNISVGSDSSRSSLAAPHEARHGHRHRAKPHTEVTHTAWGVGGIVSCGLDKTVILWA